jgi:hypothetical protein
VPFVSLELVARKWKVALHDGRRERPAAHTVEFIRITAAPNSYVATS